MLQDVRNYLDFIFGDLNLPYNYFYLSQSRNATHSVGLEYVMNSPGVKRCTTDKDVVRLALESSNVCRVLGPVLQVHDRHRAADRRQHHRLGRRG